MKARFAYSGQWSQSVIYQGQLYRYSAAKVPKKAGQLKITYACLRNDTSFRWYRDENFLERKGETWLEECASQLRFGQFATQIRGAPRFPNAKVPQLVADWLIAIPDLNDRLRKRMYFFCARSQDEFDIWVRAIADSLIGKTVKPPLIHLPFNLADRDRQRYFERRNLNPQDPQNEPNEWEVYWFLYATNTDENQKPSLIDTKSLPLPEDQPETGAGHRSSHSRSDSVPLPSNYGNPATYATFHIDPPEPIMEMPDSTAAHSTTVEVRDLD